jgi:hypothetical protein
MKGHQHALDSRYGDNREATMYGERIYTLRGGAILPPNSHVTSLSAPIQPHQLAEPLSVMNGVGGAPGLVIPDSPLPQCGGAAVAGLLLQTGDALIGLGPAAALLQWNKMASEQGVLTRRGGRGWRALEVKALVRRWWERRWEGDWR